MKMNETYIKKIINYLNKNRYPCMCIGVLVAIFFVIYRIVPPIMDLCYNAFYYSNTGGLLQFLRTEYFVYQAANGRIASNFVNGILESFKSHVVLDLFDAVVNTLIYVGLWALCKEKERFCKGAFFYTALVLLMSPQMRVEVLFYANGAYVVPVLLILLYFVLLDKLEKDAGHAVGITAWMCLVCFMICTWMENIAVGFGALLTFVCTYLFKVKDRFRYHVLCTWIVSAISGILMMLSPGLWSYRTVISDGSIIDIVKQNIRLAEEYIIGQNIPVILCFLCILLIFMITNEKAGRGIKIFYSVFIGIGIVWLLLAGLYCLWNVARLRWFYECLQFFSYPKRLIISVGVLSIFSGIVCVAFAFSKNRLMLLGIMTVCGFSLLPMLFTPNQHARVCNIGFWGIVCATVILFIEIQTTSLWWKKTLCMVSVVTIILSFDQMILVTRRIYTVQKQREEIIKEVRIRQALGDWTDDDSVTLPLFRGEDIFYGGGAVSEFHHIWYMKYYGLKEDTQVIFEEGK